MTYTDTEYRDFLKRLYGQPKKIRDDIPDEVIVFAHESKESAEAYADGDTLYYDHPTSVELREGVGWVHTVDFRPAIARFEKERDEL